MDEHFLDKVEMLRYKLSNNNKSHVRVEIDFRYEICYFYIDKKFMLPYKFTEVLDTLKR